MRKVKRIIETVGSGVFFFAAFGKAHAHMHTDAPLDEVLNEHTLGLLLVATVFLILLAIISLYTHHLKNSIKKLLFFCILGITLVMTLYLIGSTVYLNMVSVSKGPVHWHADIEMYACGKEINLRDPKGLSNKIGSPTLHEHNDKRIHLEGVVLEPLSASVGNFFHVIGGALSHEGITVPTNTGEVTYTNGMLCPNGEAGEVQMFVYQTKDTLYAQKKVMDPEHYVISPDAAVPNGDCIIIEYDTPKETTEKLCRSYKVAEEIGKIKKGVLPLPTE